MRFLSSRALSALLLLLCLPLLAGCGANAASSLTGPLSYAVAANSGPMATYSLTGDTHRVLDPSLIRQGSTWYAFSTDVVTPTDGANLPIRCSSDQVSWTRCGQVFSAGTGGLPVWVRSRFPGITMLWAPDISYVNGQYRVYYSASTLGSQSSAIGLAINTTLDSSDPTYKWVDQGLVLSTSSGGDANAIDPNLLVDTDGSQYLQWGSYWTGIKQVQLDPVSGKPAAGGQRWDLAARPTVAHHPIEGASLVHHGDYYYLFVSIDYCCNADNTTDNYKEAVGRSTSPHGPFLDMSGTPMLQGGATVLLDEEAEWRAAGGGTLYTDPETGNSTLIFHALHMTENGLQYMWLTPVNWSTGWPVLGVSLKNTVPLTP